MMPTLSHWALRSSILALAYLDYSATFMLTRCCQAPHGFIWLYMALTCFNYHYIDNIDYIPRATKTHEIVGPAKKTRFFF